MGGFLAAVKGARKMEWIIVAAAAAALALLLMSQNAAESDRTRLEARMEAVLSDVRGAGRVRVLVSEEGDAAGAFAASDANSGVRGAVIVADGADDVRVALELASAAQALLGLEPEKIQVLKMEGRP
jgi:hypothetical protein